MADLKQTEHKKCIKFVLKFLLDEIAQINYYSILQYYWPLFYWNLVAHFNPRSSPLELNTPIVQWWQRNIYKIYLVAAHLFNALPKCLQFVFERAHGGLAYQNV